MKELTREQMEIIIPQLMKDNLIGHGSSRACYLVEFEGQQYAAKVGLDFGGVYQNEREKDLYNNHSDLDILANIHYFYEDVLLLEDYMEEVFDTEDVCFVCDIDEEDEEAMENAPFTLDIIMQIKDVVWTLEDFQGETSDNYQLGAIGDHVYAYDYGYQGFDGFSDQVGCVNNYLNIMSDLMWAFLDGKIASGLDTDKYIYYTDDESEE